MNRDNPFSVSELNAYLKKIVDSDNTLKNIALKGEISNYNRNVSGHVYFSLKDEKSSINIVMFSMYAEKLKTALENGMRVIAVGSVSVFNRNGNCQFYANSIIPDGIGDLFLAFEQLKEKLSKKGMFSVERKKPIPKFPKKIALVTSPTGAAIHDMLRVLRHRFPPTKVLIVPVKVQGAGAAEEIAHAIGLINAKNAADLIIVGRGGGSIEDLWCFNEEMVAYAIFNSRIPIISAVGHEPDFTISDFVADLRAATPSNAAELAVPDFTDLIARINDSKARITNILRMQLDYYSTKLDAFIDKQVLSSPLVYINERSLVVDFVSQRFESAGKLLVSIQERRLGAMAAQLDAMSPLKVLGRGYSITRHTDGKAVRKASELTVGNKVNIMFSHGTARCDVISIEE